MVVFDNAYEAVPKTEWGEDFSGNPQGPWRHNFTIFFLDLRDGSKLICSNSTYGQQKAYFDLKDRIQSMRQLRNARVFPIVELSSKPMKTRYGMKSRPHFEIKDWRCFGPAPAAIAGPPGNPVAEPTTKEIIKDDLPPWDDDFPSNI